MQALRDQLREYRYERRVPAPRPPNPPAPRSRPETRSGIDCGRSRPDTEENLRRFSEELPRSLDRWLTPGRARLGVTCRS